ncbi:hypothetical protein [uncultured Roseobacter sp.]|uniref:hypothetical protein n=1 Tax=uncultured Roseobacter sp. TaxID=114847 RepID=UPI00260B0C65|nr:hypothetical protein [uncultured Roseobacter sp.]
MHIRTPVTPSHCLLLWNARDDFPNAPEFMQDAGWSVLHFACVEDFRAKAATMTVDVLLWPVDPLSAENLESLREVVFLLSGSDPLVMTYARFNPRWMGNLMEQSGSQMHFQDVPSLRDVLSVVQAQVETAGFEKRRGT